MPEIKEGSLELDLGLVKLGATLREDDRQCAWAVAKNEKGSPYEIQNQFPQLKDYLKDWRELRRVMQKVEETLRNEYKRIRLQ